jgi:hypothetical protein
MCKPSTSAKTLRGLSLLGFLVPIPSVGQAADVTDIEMRRLLEPTPSELAQEASGRIYIYDGLRDIDIEHAMRDHFDRVEHMMFIRTKKTDPSGALKRDKTTGEVEVEDDDC